MNKKYYYGLFAAGMLFATSCSNDELTQVQSGEYAEVSISLGVEEVAGSRAISDGSGADELYYSVFDADGNRITTIQQVHRENVDFPTTETITLAKGQTYQVAFWAQDNDCEAYTVSDDMNVTVNYAGINNDETRDAFFKTVKFTVNGSTALDVELTRPFAQINVGVDAADWNAAVASGIEIKESNVTIKQAASAINLVTGKVSKPLDVVYTTAAIPNEPLKANNGTYNWLSMSYILVFDGSETGAEDATLTSLEYKFSPKQGKGNPITFKDGLNNVPVKRNWRTNILGKILTGDITFNISIDPIYEGDKNYPDGPAQELELAATFGGTVTLNEDVTLTAPLNVTADMILNLENGAKLKGSINVAKGASLTVNGGAIVNTDDNVSGIVSNGDLTLNNVEITSARHALRIESGNVVINGGTYKVAPQSVKTLHALNVGDDNTVANVTIKGGTFVGPKGTGADSGSAVNVRSGSSVTIEGGDFSGGKNETLDGNGTFTVTGGTFDQKPAASYVATGYKVLNSNGKYVVVTEEIDAAYTSQEDLNNATFADYTVIALTAGKYVLPDAAAGKIFTIKGTDNPADVILVAENDGASEGNCDYSLRDSKVTFNNVTITTTGTYFPGYAYMEGTFNNCIINGVYTVYKSSSFNDCTFNIEGDLYNLWTWGGEEVNLNNCTFNCDGKAVLLYGQANTKLTINNCTFNDNGTIADKAAIEIGNDYNTSYELTVNNTVVNGFDINPKGYNTGTTLWANKNSMKPENLKVTVDGKNAYIIVVSDETDIESAITEGTTVGLPAGTYTMPNNDLFSEGVTLVCEEGTVFEGNSKLNINGATVIGAKFSNPSGTAVD